MNKGLEFSGGSGGSAPLASPTFTGIVTIPDGTAVNPSLVFASDANSGFYYNAKGFGYAVDGVSKFSVDNTGITSGAISLKLGTTSIATYSNIGFSNATAGMDNFAGAAAALFHFKFTPNFANTKTTGSIVCFSILPNYNQASGDAANTDLLINRTQTAVGSGAQLLIDVQVGSTSKWKASNVGNTIQVGSLTTGAPNGGTAGAWKLGTIVTGQIGLAIVTTQYIEVDIGGTLYKLATVV